MLLAATDLRAAAAGVDISSDIAALPTPGAAIKLASAVAVCIVASASSDSRCWPKLGTSSMVCVASKDAEGAAMLTLN
jgi:hypothetical protein